MVHVDTLIWPYARYVFEEDSRDVPSFAQRCELDGVHTAGVVCWAGAGYDRVDIYVDQQSERSQSGRVTRTLRRWEAVFEW